MEAEDLIPHSGRSESQSVEFTWQSADQAVLRTHEVAQEAGT